jgi:hypothetical protein
MIVPSRIGPLEIEPQASRLGPYLTIRQGSWSVSVEVAALHELVAALYEAAGVKTIALELGDRCYLVPGELALDPGEYLGRFRPIRRALDCVIPQ